MRLLTKEDEMGVGTNQQRSKKSALLHQHIGSTNYGQPNTTDYSDQRGSRPSSLVRPREARERNESQRPKPERDTSYGIHKVAPPLFYEVALAHNISKVANRLRQFGRAFP